MGDDLFSALQFADGERDYRNRYVITCAEF